MQLREASFQRYVAQRATDRVGCLSRGPVRLKGDMRFRVGLSACSKNLRP